MAPTSFPSSFFPILVVSNIKTHVPITLEMENVQYTNWAELFKWIYSTILTDLLNTVIEVDVSSMTLWNRLCDLFQDNENSHAVSLEHEFNNTYLKDFSSVSAYCQHLKTLSDQLKNMGAPISNNRLVLRMLGGLTLAYKGVSSIIHHKKILPPFYEVRSMLALEETSMKEVTADDAMMVTNHDIDEISNHPPSIRARGKQNKLRNNNKNHKPTSSGVQMTGVGRGGNRGGGPNLSGDPNWYMDTGATSHMTSTQGNLSSYVNMRKDNGVTVGSGQSIPIRGYDHTLLPSPNPPLSLKHTGRRLMRCDSTSSLYPITPTRSHPTSSPTTLLTSTLWHDRFGHPGDGKTQRVGIDCGETFSLVVNPATIRIMLSLALSKQCLWDFEIKCILIMSIYCVNLSMTQTSPSGWYKRFADFVSSIGFSNSKSDTSLFLYKHGSDMAYLLLYVDDIILTASSEHLRKSIMAHLNSEFAMKDLGFLNYFLGISVTRHKGGLFLSQQKYAEDIIDRAGMHSFKPIQTPFDTKPKVSATSGARYADPAQYRSLAGALQYLTFTRPDISYAIQQICLYMHDPRDEHMNALKRIIRYIQGTLHLGLHISPSSITDLVSYTDADWGGCPDTRRSTSGYCVFLGDNLISWSSKRQPTLSRSSVEAEYRGVANVVSESYWLRNLLLELNCPICKATMVYCDNVSAIYLSGNPIQHQRTKHIEMDINFVREKVARGEVRVCHVPSRVWKVTSSYPPLTPPLSSSLAAIARKY
ncbi:UDP-N-acetylglucosamine 1-carboxyvinyltransferase 2-like [Hibiscus syriacus]|uniref:UDP-N-acetylglucosamine 1-carboxyvinyltransferase 2-like n=1 Tax=Hibiscus syriacus TaxID=106335 RepID=A0A6A2Y3Y5_HIBSY|nr:UDP-N-acetylglucosamine 1-carboxyvinyltransferase 2-like [Hibiscus syriacus]